MAVPSAVSPVQWQWVAQSSSDSKLNETQNLLTDCVYFVEEAPGFRWLGGIPSTLSSVSPASDTHPASPCLAHFPTSSLSLIYCGPGWHAWGSPFGVCTHLSVLIFVLRTSFSQISLSIIQQVTHLASQEGALGRHDSPAPLPLAALPVATHFPCCRRSSHPWIQGEKKQFAPPSLQLFLAQGWVCLRVTPKRERGAWNRTHQGQLGGPLEALSVPRDLALLWTQTTELEPKAQW